MGADHIDYSNLLVGVLLQGIDDYVKMQHPHARAKHRLEDSFLSAFDFLFDDEYRMQNLKNESGEDMSLRDLICSVLDTERPDVERLRDYARTQCVKYWEDKKVAVFDPMPSTLCLAGQTFNVQHATIKDYTVDWDNVTILLDTKAGQASQLVLMEAVLDIIASLRTIGSMGSRTRKTLAREILWALKVNNCFSSAVQDQAGLAGQ